MGEHTAGAMLSSETVTLPDGWYLVVPDADYITADGVRLEGRGVPPHEEVPADQALEEALRMVRCEVGPVDPPEGTRVLRFAFRMLREAPWPGRLVPPHPSCPFA